MTADRKPSSKPLRLAISALVLGHLLAVVLPPLSFQARGPLGLSPSVASLFRHFEGYSQFMYIDRGYAFFAPDPGPSHLIQAAVTDRDGKRVEIMFPDRNEQWPRLLYHRHFMLTEFLEEIYQPPGPPRELAALEPEEAELWIRARSRYEHVRQSYVEHLRHEYQDHNFAIRRIEHLIPEVLAFQEEPIELTDPSLYRVILDRPVAYDLEDNLLAPSSPPESVPPPTGAALQREARRSGARAGADRQSETPSASAVEQQEADSTEPTAASEQPSSDNESGGATTDRGDEQADDQADSQGEGPA